MRGIIFDMDGVLIDSLDAWVEIINATLEHFKCEKRTREDIIEHFGQPTEEDLKWFCPGVTVEQVESHYGEIFPQFVEELKLVADARELLDELRKRGIKMAIATNTPRGIARELLGMVGIKEYFSAVVGGDEVKKAKPDPESLNRAAERLNIGKSELIYVGDSTYDMQAGKNAGIFTVGFRINGDERVDELLQILEFVEEKC